MHPIVWFSRFSDDENLNIFRDFLEPRKQEHEKNLIFCVENVDFVLTTDYPHSMQTYFLNQKLGLFMSSWTPIGSPLLCPEQVVI